MSTTGPTAPYRIVRIDAGRIVEQLGTVEDLASAHDLQAGQGDRVILDSHDSVVVPKHRLTRAEWDHIPPDYRGGNLAAGTALAVIRHPKTEPSWSKSTSPTDEHAPARHVRVNGG